MKLKKHDKLAGVDFYFAGYDFSVKDCCHWVRHLSGAIDISNRDAADKLVRFLYVNAGLNTDIFHLEVIDNDRKLLQKNILRQL